MIKKKIVVIILCLSLTIITICPIRTVHGKTLRDYKNELSTLQQQQANNKQQINTTSSQVTAKQNAIFNSENQIKANEKAVEEAKVKIFKKEMLVKDINWLLIDKLEGKMEVRVKTRYSANEEKATIEMLNEETVRVEFETPVARITPGQSAVFYIDDIVVGGGKIA